MASEWFRGHLVVFSTKLYFEAFDHAGIDEPRRNVGAAQHLNAGRCSSSPIIKLYD